MAKTTAGAKKARHDISVGWRFWIVVFLLLFGPAWYWSSKNAFDDQKTGLFPWASAFVIATLGAGFISWAANLVFQAWSRRMRTTRQKKR